MSRVQTGHELKIFFGYLIVCAILFSIVRGSGIDFDETARTKLTAFVCIAAAQFGRVAYFYVMHRNRQEELRQRRDDTEIDGIEVES